MAGNETGTDRRWRERQKGWIQILKSLITIWITLHITVKPLQQAQKSCLIMKPQRDGGQVFWIPLEKKWILQNENKVSLVRAYEGLSFIWQCFKSHFYATKKSHFDGNVGSGNEFVIFWGDESVNEMRQLHFTYSWTLLSLQAKWKASSQKAYSWFISHHRIITFSADDSKLKSFMQKNNHLDPSLSQYIDKQGWPCFHYPVCFHTSNKTNSGSCILGKWYFCEHRCSLSLCLLDISVTCCKPDSAVVGGEAQWEECQLGSSGAMQVWCQSWSGVTTTASEGLCYLSGFAFLRQKRGKTHNIRV